MSGAMKPAAVHGDYSDFRLVRTRRVVQIVVEVPIESAPRVLETLGFPDPAGGTPVAVVLLEIGSRPYATGAGSARDACQDRADGLEGPDPPPEKPAAGGSPARKWRELPQAQQAAIRCSDVEFRKWLDTEFGYICASSPELTAVAIRNHCGVNSRAELNTNDIARGIWQSLDSEYLEWAGRQAEQRG